MTRGERARLNNVLETSPRSSRAVGKGAVDATEGADTVVNVQLYRGISAEDLLWMDNALCRQTDPEAFFPEKGGTTALAKAVCRHCEVRADCLQYALDNDERFGVWGGLSERERRRLKKRSTPRV